MVREPGWVKTAAAYAAAVNTRHPDAVVGPADPGGGVGSAEHLAALGITWSPFDVHQIQHGGVQRARHRFRQHLPDLIWNAAALEGNTFTLPEVRTLLDGVTVGGKPLNEAQQILSLSQAYNHLDQLVSAGTFRLNKATSDQLHALVARHEADDSGHFRGEGSGTGGGHVRLSNGGVVDGAPHGIDGADLRAHHTALLDHLDGIADPRGRALLYFAAATRRQFYFDGNKRAARLMMAGELMSHGFDAVSVQYARKLEFNVALDILFTTDDATVLLNLLGTCVD